MKALVCTRFGPPQLLEYRDVPPPQLAPHQVLVSMAAASVNFPDVLIIQDKYQFKAPLPFSPGGELAGIVKAVGSAVDGFEVGHRVMAFTVFGAFAEEVAVDAACVLRIPEGMNDAVAASLLLAYGTMDHALRDRAALSPSDTVLVLGAAGGIGLAAIEIARAVGARVIACASSPEKLAACRAHGADEVIDYAAADLRGAIKTLTDGRGVDVVVDPVGGGMTESALRSMAWRGRLLVVGFASGAIPKIPLNLVLLKGCAIVGVFWGDFVRREPARLAASIAQLAGWHQTGKIAPHISATLPLSRGAEALAMVADRTVIGKIVLQP